MMKQTSLLYICLLSFLHVAFGQEIEQERQFQHHIYAAFGSPSLYASVNYELNLVEKSDFTLLPRLGVGFNLFQPSTGKEWNVNTGITGLYGKKGSKMEASLGWVHQVYPSYGYEQEKDIAKYKGVVYTGLGYRYQPKTHGFMFKFLITPTFTINSGQWVFFPYVEIGLGYTIRAKRK
jgi:hypothetical protein